jgi:hypothetical protein
LNTVMNFGFRKMLGNYVVAQLAASQEGLSFMELVTRNNKLRLPVHVTNTSPRLRKF